MGKCMFMRKGEIHTIGVPLSKIADGSVVTLNENGNPVEYSVTKNGDEITLNGDARTLVVPSTATLQADGTLYYM